MDSNNFETWIYGIAFIKCFTAGFLIVLKKLLKHCYVNCKSLLIGNPAPPCLGFK